jgi:uncharacterized protein
MTDRDALDLLDWKRRMFALYSEVRSSSDPQRAWHKWRETRDEMFRTHPQSPIPAKDRSGFQGLELFPYDAAYRVEAKLLDAEPQHYDIPTSGDSTMSFTRFAHARFELQDMPLELEIYWLDAYGGGVFLPFRDTTSGNTTYGAGRYLLDTVKGADLGSKGDGLILDFNFAYNPSCSYDARWVCPLSPPANRLDIAIEAGEKHSG